MAKKPKLQPRHRQHRRQWAEQYRNLTVAHWNHVIFADESRYMLYPVDGRLRVRRQVGERLNDENVQARVQGGGGSVHVWGAFCATGVSQLIVLDQNVNGARYREIYWTRTCFHLLKGCTKTTFAFNMITLLHTQLEL